MDKLSNKIPRQEKKDTFDDCMMRRQALKRTGMAVAGLAILGSTPIVINSFNRTKNLQLKALSNLFKMGHCAPTVARTLMDTSYRNFEPIIKMAGAMASGIGNLGAECGGLTGSALFFGAQFGLNQTRNIPPELITNGRLLMERFKRVNGTLFCREILGDGNLMACIRAIRTSPNIAYSICKINDIQSIRDGNQSSHSLSRKSERDSGLSLYQAQNTGWDRFLKEFENKDFHCCHHVFDNIGLNLNAHSLIKKSTSGFLGGMFLSGLTCCALSAGVMAIGLKIGEIENSYFSVIKMMKMMAMNDDRAMDDDVNRFNASINSANQLVNWFKEEFGSTKCQDLINTDFSSADHFRTFCANNQIMTCKQIGEAVAYQTGKIIFG